MNQLLAAVVAEAKRTGMMGVAIWDQGGPRGIVAGLLTKDARIAASPRSWDTHATPEAAVRDLASRMNLPESVKTA